MNVMHLAWSNIGRNKRRSLVTIVLTAVGTAGLLLAAGFALYTYEGLKEFSVRDTGNLILSHQDFFAKQEETPMEFGMDNADQVRKQLIGDDRVRQVLPEVSLTGLVTNGTKSTIFMGTGISPARYTLMGPALSLKEGKVLSRNPDPMAEAEVILGQKLAAVLSVEPGDGLTLLSTTVDGVLNAIDVQVRGIVSTGVPEIDERLINMHLQTAQDLMMTDKVSTLSVYLYDEADTQDMANLVTQNWQSLLVTHWEDRAFFYRSVKDLYNRIFGVMGVIILCLVLFAVVNTMTMAVMERTREIGALSAMGTFRSELVKLFVAEGGMISGIGAVLGMLLAGSVTLMLLFTDFQMPPPPGQTEGYPLQIYFSLEAYGWVGVLMIFVGALAAGFAATRGVRKPIVEALAHV